MVRGSIVCGLLLLLSFPASGDQKTGAKLPKAPTNPGLEKMKKLAEPGSKQGRQAERAGRVGHQGDGGRQRSTKRSSPARRWRWSRSTPPKDPTW